MAADSSAHHDEERKAGLIIVGMLLVGITVMIELLEEVSKQRKISELNLTLWELGQKIFKNCKFPKTCLKPGWMRTQTSIGAAFRGPTSPLKSKDDMEQHICILFPFCIIIIIITISNKPIGEHSGENLCNDTWTEILKKKKKQFE